jgi:hypothetical protein
MLQLTNLSGFGAGAAAGSSVSNYLIDILTELSLTTNLNLVLDFADVRSYDGSSQSVTDASGNGNTFYLGTGSGSDASDPTFAGSVGNPGDSTYLSFDGADCLTENGSLTFAQNWHKNNGAFTVIALYYIPSAKASRSTIFCTREPANAQAGVSLQIAPDGKTSMRRSTTTTTSQVTDGVSATVATGWNFVAMGFDEATTTFRARINSTAEDVTGLTASTDTDANSAEYTIGVEGVGTVDDYLQSGERIACVAAWSSFLSDASLALIYNRLKLRITSIP